MKKQLLIAAAATVVASSAMAQSAFEGAFGQIGIGYESVPSKLSGGTATINNVANTPYTGSIATSNSIAGNVSAGYYFGVTKTFLLGIGADYSPLAGQKGDATLTANGVSGVAAQSQKTNSYNLFVSPAIAIDKDKLAYAKLGYTGATIKVVDTPETGGATNTFNYTGYSFGLGYKQMFTSGLYGFAEGNYAMYGKENLRGEGVTGTIQPSSMNFLVGVGYKF
jgi:opacity protein-like surface antigen